MVKSDGLSETKRLMAALGRMPPKPHEEMKVGNRKAKKAASPKGKKATKMNPLEWKREHQIALGLAVIIGLGLGEIVGFALNGRGDRFARWVEWSFYYEYDTFGGFMWGIFGALIGAAFIYAIQLMRR